MTQLFLDKRLWSYHDYWYGGKPLLIHKAYQIIFRISGNREYTEDTSIQLLFLPFPTCTHFTLPRQLHQDTGISLSLPCQTINKRYTTTINHLYSFFCIWYCGWGWGNPPNMQKGSKLLLRWIGKEVTIARSGQGGWWWGPSLGSFEPQLG